MEELEARRVEELEAGRVVQVVRLMVGQFGVKFVARLILSVKVVLAVEII